MRLEDEYNYNILLRITSENFKEIFQLIKDDITKENPKMRELIPPRLQLAATIGFWSTGELHKELCLWVLLFFLLNYEQFNIHFFLRFRLLNLFFSNQKSKSPDLISIH